MGRQEVPTDHPGRADNPEDIRWYREGRRAMLEDVLELANQISNGPESIDEVFDKLMQRLEEMKVEQAWRANQKRRRGHPAGYFGADHGDVT